MTTFGERLKQLRKERELTLEMLVADFFAIKKQGTAEAIPCSNNRSLIQFIIKPHQQDHADGEECKKPLHTSLTFMVYVRHIQPTPLLSLPQFPDCSMMVYADPL